jgi:serine protease Do
MSPARPAAANAWRVRLPLAGLAFPLVTLWLPLAGLAQTQRTTDTARASAIVAIEQTLVDAIARAEPSVVAISRSSTAQPDQRALIIDDLFGGLRGDAATDATPNVVAAGVIIDPAGLVLTQYLAVQEGDAHTITTTDGRVLPVTIRAADPRSGLAILAINAPVSQLQRSGETPTAQQPSLPAIRFGDAAKLRKGQFVIAIGNPYAVASDGQPTASWGIVTNVARKAPPNSNFNNAPGPLGDYRTTLHHLGTLIQTDAKLGWSAGGGALVNLQGELVGLTTTAATIAGHEQPAGYAIPINGTFRRIIEVLKDGREVEYGMLGVSFDTRLQPTANSHSQVAIADVFPGSPADRAGLARGDVVIRIGDTPVNDFDAIQLAVSAKPPSSLSTIEYERGGRTATADVKLAKLAVAGKVIATVRPDVWRGIRVDYATALDAAAWMTAIESKAYDPEGCVLVAEVKQNSPAWKAGVRPGMFISHAGGRRVSTPEEFREAVPKLGNELDIQLTQPLQPAGKQSKPGQNN